MIESARARVEGWSRSLLESREELVERLLDAPEGASCISIPGVDPEALGQGLTDGAGYMFEAGCDPALELGWLRVPLPSHELTSRLGGLRRASSIARATTGDHLLWLALGQLTWADRDGVARTAPLVLWPVELERASGGGLRLVAADGLPPRLNDALDDRLQRDHALALPATGRVDGAVTVAAVAALLDAVEGLAMTRPGWQVAREVKLGLFSFASLTLGRDLAELGDEVAGRAVVAQLADPARPFAQPSIAAAEAVTRAPGARGSSELILPLDADASQLAVVGAAAAGASFVVDAAPGTGASQTIANLIAHGISHGQSVLFVASQLSALDTVEQRLASVGLSNFCMELAPRRGRARAVIERMGRVLDRAFRPGAGPVGDDARLAALRDGLDAHVAAMHRVGPLGRSLHQVLGRMVELRTVPCAALAEPDAIALDGATFERRRRAVADMASAAVPVEPVASHPWRESRLDAPGDADAMVARARDALDEACAASATLSAAVAEVASLVPGLVARSRAQLTALGSLATLAARSSRPGAELLTNLRTSRVDELDERVALVRARGSGTVEPPRDPLTFLALAHKHDALVDEVEQAFGEGAHDTIDELDAATLWGQLRKWLHRVGPLRFVALRAPRAAVRALAIPGSLETDEAMIAALEAVIAERACRAAMIAAGASARRWFGELMPAGDGEALVPRDLDLARIDAAVGWSAELRKAFDAVEVVGAESGRASAWRALVAQVAAAPGADATDVAPFGALAGAVSRWARALEQLAVAIGIEVGALADRDDHLPALRERVELWTHTLDTMVPWVRFHAARHAALAAGAHPAVAALDRGDLGAQELAGAWERATLRAWSDAELADTPALAGFHGAAHHAEVAAFADLDRGALGLARARTLARIAERVPRASTPHDPTPREPDVEVERLLAELKLLASDPGAEPSLAALLAELPTVRSRLAPCVLATPVAVAELLAASLPAFDLVVIDGAAALPVAEAVGALARGNAAVIVGDLVQAADDSVLAAAVAANLPRLRLHWHHRSKHEDVIAFANLRGYADRLQVLPAAHGSPDLGVSGRRVTGSTPDAEAEAVVAELMARALDPAQRTRSIGVVTLTAAQRDRIEALLEVARSADPELDQWLDPSASATADTAPVVTTAAPAVWQVGDLDGASRDVILLSVGASPSELAALGARQVWQATTCAIEQLVVFSSVGPEELRAEGEGGAPDGGAVDELAALLAFAHDGGGAARPSEDDRAAGPVVEAIARALVDRGWIVRHQVGTPSYKIDLAVVDPNDPDRYVLAIEHDGAAYASAPAARDRDRLRAQQLALLGWRLHRTWTLDWWSDPEREVQRAHGAIVTAIAAGRQRRAPEPVRARAMGRGRGLATGSSPVQITGAGRTPAVLRAAADSGGVLAAGSGPTDAMPLVELEGVSTTTRVRVARGSISIGPYTAAAIPNGRRTPGDLFAPRHLAELGKVIEQVLAAEAPIHLELLARRVGGYFGIGRLSQRVTDQVRGAVEGRGRFGDEQDVVWRLDQDPAGVPAVRVAGHGPVVRRDIAEVPLSELAAAARVVVERAAGITSNELIRDSARLLGFARITEHVTDRIARGVQLAVARELIRISDGRAVMPLE